MRKFSRSVGWLAGLTVLLTLAAASITQAQVITRSLRTEADRQKFGFRATADAQAIPTFTTKGVDKAALDREDQKAAGSGRPLRYGVSLPVDINVMQVASQTVENGMRVYRYRVYSPEANSLEFYFDQLSLIQGAELYVYDEAKTMMIGPVTATQLTKLTGFGTDLISGSRAIIEVREPVQAQQSSQLHLSRITHGDKSLSLLAASCHNDVACYPSYQPEANGVAKMFIYDGVALNYICSGALVTNTRQNFKSYFLTAFHCLDLVSDRSLSAGEISNLAFYRFRFNYQETTCNAGADDFDYVTLNGSQLRSAWSDTDMSLLELLQTPPIDERVSYVGWDRSAAIPATSFGIHHPRGDPKKISFVNTAPAIVSLTSYDEDGYTTGPGTNFFEVTWANGTTEGGSSGSPLFNSSKRIIGQLLGGNGGSNPCPPGKYSDYGRVFRSWTGGGNSSTRLNNWLDPTATGATTTNTIVPTVAGSDNLCNSGTYSLNTGSGVPVTWEIVSGSSYVTPTSGSGSTAALTALPGADGNFVSIRFSVNDGQSYDIQFEKDIRATYTPAPSMTTAAGQTIAAPGQTAVTVQQFTGNVLFTADNCAGGTINWSGGGLSGTGILVAPTSAVGTVTYTSTCTRTGCTGPASTVTVTVSAGPTPLLVVTPAFNCNTGLFVFQTVGGNGTPIEFSAIGITGWTTVPQHSIASNLRNDATLAPFTLRARQSGREVQISWDLRAFCNSPNLTPLLIDNPIPNLTGTVGQLFQYTVPANTFRDPDGQPLTYSATGLPTGLGLSNGTISGVPSTTGVFNAVITASDPGGRSIGTGFTITINPAAGSSIALQLVAPTYNCATGSLTFQTTGGNGTPIEFMAVGITGWSTTATHVLPLSLRTDINLAPFTLMARQGGTGVAFTWDLRAACTIGTINQPPVSTPVPAQIGVVGQPYNFNLNTHFSDPDGQALVYSLSGLPNGLTVSTSGFITGTPTTAGVSSVQVTARDPFFQQTTQTFFFTVNPAGPVVGALALIAPLYDCQTGQFVFRATGGNGTPIEFRSVGVTDWTTSVNHVISPVLINEPGTQPFPLQARQNGVVVTLSWNLRLACSAANLPPIQLRPLPAQVATVGQPFTFDLSSYFGDPESLALQYSLDVFGGTIGGLVVNGVTGVITGRPTNAGAFNLGVRVTDVNGSNIVASMAFVISPAPVVPISPALQLVAPSYNCATRQLTFNTSGGDGSLIEFRAVGVTDWSSNANHVIEAGVTADLNNSLITLMARQSGVNVSYPFNFRAGCPSARLGADEPQGGLVVTVRGNPISGDEVELDVNGAEGQAVRLRLIDTGGRLVTERTIERAVSTERVRMRLGQQAGLYLVQVSTANQRTTVRALRVN